MTQNGSNPVGRLSEEDQRGPGVLLGNGGRSHAIAIRLRASDQAGRGVVDRDPGTGKRETISQVCGPDQGLGLRGLEGQVHGRDDQHVPLGILDCGGRYLQVVEARGQRSSV